MSPSIIAAIIAASVAAVTGIINIIISFYKNRQDGITKYRMDWINEVRQEYTNILSWSWYYQDKDGKLFFNSVEELRKSVNKAGLLLNVRDNYDYEIIKMTMQYLNIVENAFLTYKISEYSNNNILTMQIAAKGSQLTEKSKPIKKELQKMIRVYLKTEWTRVKFDSSITKIGYYKYWKPFVGFNAEKAIKGFSKEYKEID